MDKSLERDIKKLVFDILSIIILLLIVVPIYTNASENYKEKSKERIKFNVYTEINNINNEKRIKINNLNKDKVNVNLVLKINKHLNQYSLFLDNNEYNLSELDYTEENEYLYYNLENYDIDKNKTLTYRLEKNIDYGYDDEIRYSFLLEDATC